MNRLAELLLKWSDQSLTEEEVSELNSLLKEPSARKELLDSFSFDSQLLDSIQSLSAVERTSESAEQYETREVRSANPFAEKPPAFLPLPKGCGRSLGGQLSTCKGAG